MALHERYVESYTHNNDILGIYTFKQITEKNIRIHEKVINKTNFNRLEKFDCNFI